MLPHVIVMKLGRKNVSVIFRNALELHFVNIKKKMKGIRLADEKFVSGKGRLTDVMINRIQNYFG